MIDMVVSDRDIKNRLGKLAGQSGRVIARAANTTIATGKKAIAQETVKKYIITQRDVNRDLKTKRATYGSPVARLIYRGHNKNLYNWTSRGVRSVTPGVVIQWRHGRPNIDVYKAHIMKDHPKVAFSRGPKPFVQVMHQGEGEQTIMVQRVSDKKNERILKGIQAPAIAQIVKNEKVTARFHRDAGTMLQKRLDHEIDQVLKGH